MTLAKHTKLLFSLETQKKISQWQCIIFITDFALYLQDFLF
jgi:hypothetical protein